MGLFDKFKNKKQENVVAEFDNFKMVLKPYVIDSLFRVNLPVQWEPYESDRFRAKTEKTEISITNWNLNNSPPITGQYIKDSVLPLFEKFVTEGGYEPYNDLIANDKYIAQSFKVDHETQYYLHLFFKAGNETYRSGFIIRDIGDYDPQLRATLLIIAETYRVEAK